MQQSPFPVGQHVDLAQQEAYLMKTRPEYNNYNTLAPLNDLYMQEASIDLQKMYGTVVDQKAIIPQPATQTPFYIPTETQNNRLVREIPKAPAAVKEEAKLPINFINREKNTMDDPDEEWTYNAPQYYNVKTTSVQALEDYKYTVMYKHSKKSGRTVRYFLCQYDNCDKKFNKSWNFIDHMRMHNGEKPYKCRDCEKEFTQKGNYNKHCRIHI